MEIGRIEKRSGAGKRPGVGSAKVRRDAAKIVLQDRDYEILLWLNEMGPQDAVIVGLHFFCSRGDALSVARVETASRRLRELSAAGFTQGFRIELKRQNVYRATSRAAGVLQAHYPMHRQLKAQTAIGLTTFEHNVQVAWTRVALERRGDATRHE